MKQKFTAIFLALAIVFSLAACSNSDTGDGDSEISASTSSSIATILDLGDAANITSVQKDVINVGIPSDPANFAPWGYSGAGANQALMSLYQPLLHHEDGEYYSSIAKSDFVMADDYLSVDFEIFDNIYDWDGNHITVDDVIFSYTKCGEIQPQYARLISEIEKTGEYTCTFHFSEPLSMVDFDSFVRIFIVSEQAYNDSPDGMSTTPVGTGPYKMTDYTSGYSMTYEKVEDFWQTDMDELCVRDMANVDTINFYVISESAQRTMALQNGTIDICMSINDEDLDQFDGQNGYQVVQIESNGSLTLFCNCDSSSLCSDLNLRLAICYAISNDAILQGVLNGDGVVNHELTPSYATGYNSEWDEEENYYMYDTDKAAEYLAQSNYNNETLVIICNSDDSNKSTAELVQNFLEQIGISTSIESYEDTVFEQYIQDESKWDIMVDETQYNTYYIEGIYGSFSEERYASGGGINFVYDDYLQELIVLCLSRETYSEENLELIHDYIIENCYVMGLATGVDSFVVPDYVTGLALNFRGFILPGGCTYS